MNEHKGCVCLISLLQRQMMNRIYSKTGLQGTLRWEDTLWSGDVSSDRCPIVPVSMNQRWRDNCHVGTLWDSEVSLEGGSTVLQNQPTPYTGRISPYLSLYGSQSTKTQLSWHLWRLYQLSLKAGRFSSGWLSLILYSYRSYRSRWVCLPARTCCYAVRWWWTVHSLCAPEINQTYMENAI